MAIDAICLCCPTQGSCVSHGTPTSSDYSAMETPVVHVKRGGQSAFISPYHLHDLQRVLDQHVCSLLSVL